MFIGAARLATRMKAHAGQPVTYRDGEAAVSLIATYGRREAVVESGGVLEQHEQWDFTITAADLVLLGVVTLPRVGAVFEVTVAGQLKTYEVLPLAGQDCFRPCDPYGVQLRVHTKLIPSE